MPGTLRGGAALWASSRGPSGAPEGSAGTHTRCRRASRGTQCGARSLPRHRTRCCGHGHRDRSEDFICCSFDLGD